MAVDGAQLALAAQRQNTTEAIGDLCTDLKAERDGCARLRGELEAARKALGERDFQILALEKEMAYTQGAKGKG